MSKSKFKRFYRNTPNHQQAYMENFLLTHPQKRLLIDEITWQYYDSHTDSPAILLLHGGFVDFSMWIHQIIAFKDEYRVIAPTCPVLSNATMQNYGSAIRAILDYEKVKRVNVMGYSEGGLIAQCFLRAQPSRIDKVILGHTFFPTRENKYFQYDFNLFRILPACLTTFLFKTLAKPDPEELQADTPWKAWFRGYFKELKSKLTKPIILTHIDLMRDFVRNYSFHSNDLSTWRGSMLITVSADDVVYSYFEGMKMLYPMAETHVFSAGLGAHSIALISPQIFNQRISAFLGK
jgi:pimeloyl-ACP methyl ester carboxylesterase